MGLRCAYQTQALGTGDLGLCRRQAKGCSVLESMWHRATGQVALSKEWQRCAQVFPVPSLGLDLQQAEPCPLGRERESGSSLAVRGPPFHLSPITLVGTPPGLSASHSGGNVFLETRAVSLHNPTQSYR